MQFSRDICAPCYLSLMIHAYSKVTGQNHEETLESLGIAGLIAVADIKPVEDEQLLKDLCRDPCGVLAWTAPNRIKDFQEQCAPTDQSCQPVKPY
ncbi:MAG: hypothetical protein R6V21_06060 [Pelovirga sp.]